MAGCGRAQRPSGQNISDSFIGVLNGDGTDVRNAWAPSYLRQDGWGDPWVAYGFGLPADAQVLRHAIAAYPEPGYLGEQDSRSNAVDEVQDSVGEIVVVNTNGIASARDNAGHSYLAFQSARFCVQGDCICPANTLRAGEKMAEQEIDAALRSGPQCTIRRGEVPGRRSQDGRRVRSTEERRTVAAAQQPGRWRSSVRPGLRRQQRRPAPAHGEQRLLRLPGRRRVHAAPLT